MPLASNPNDIFVMLFSRCSVLGARESRIKRKTTTASAASANPIKNKLFPVNRLNAAPVFEA
jgi:hypothetical protein